MELSGLPGVVGEIVDISSILANQIKGKICVQLITKRGQAGKVYSIGSWTEFKRKLGSLRYDGVNDPKIAKRALDGGARLIITRAFHYTDVEDISTAEGTKATATLTETTNTAVITALAVGNYYNSYIVTTVVAKSGNSGYVDFKLEIPDHDQIIWVREVNQTPSTAQQVAINERFKEFDIEIGTITNLIPIASVTLATGAQDVTDIVDADYKGDATQKNGWHAFDSVTDSMRIANVNNASPGADIDLVAYCVARQDMRAITRTCLGLTLSGVEDYREGTGVYSHTPIDSFYGALWYTDGMINDESTPPVEIDFILIGDMLARRSIVDRKYGEWFSHSGGKRGKMPGINGVAINALGQGNKAAADDLYERGVNFIVDHDSFAIVPWGNRTLLADTTKLTSKENIADLVVYAWRMIKSIVEIMSFDPNDFLMFNELYRRVLPFIHFLVDNRAIQGDSEDVTKGENKWWFWFGDQFATTPDDLTYNSQGDIDAGKYRIRFAFKPIAANEYIGIEIAPADTATLLNVTQSMSSQG